MMNIDSKYQKLLLEALEDLMYKVSLQLEDLKGEPVGKTRKVLTKKQDQIEELQHTISSFPIEIS